jgi:hypothetical protein
MSLRAKYKMLKSLTILIGAVTIPWGTFIGFCFGEGRYSIGLAALCVQVIVSLTDGYIWFWVMENMKEKMEKQLVNSSDKSVSLIASS